MNKILTTIGFLVLTMVGAQAATRQTVCTATIIPKNDPKLQYYTLIWSDSQGLLVVVNSDKLYFDKVVSVDPGYPFVTVRARTSSNTMLVVHFIVPNYVNPKDAEYPKETLTVLGADGTSVTDECGQAE